MSSGFVTESEIEEARKKRQEEWEKVRNADDPIEAPEPTYDSRSLYERLQEQKQKKDLEYEEAHKLKNMIKGLDDDEIDFLDLVDKAKMAVDRRKMIEEEKELNDYRNRVANLQEQNYDKKKQTENNVKPKSRSSCSKNSQMQLLKAAVIAKPSTVKRKNSETEKDNQISYKKLKETSNEEDKRNKRKLNDSVESEGNSNSVMKCIGILPGMGYYTPSSSEDSSDSDQDFNLADILQKPAEKKDGPKQ